MACIPFTMLGNHHHDFQALPSSQMETLTSKQQLPILPFSLAPVTSNLPAVSGSCPTLDISYNGLIKYSSFCVWHIHLP